MSLALAARVPLMNDIARWLEELGLGKYVEAFESHEIDATVLPEVTEEDLREMGIPIGPRRKILKAIREQVPQGLPVAPPPSPASASEADPPGAPLAPSPEAERRQLTVMFSDLAGSTELSARLDPEDLREINRAYQDAVTAAIERFGGYVARYMGDGVLAYFGYPQAHEDDAERAARAALEIVDRVPALDTGVELSVRVGIATGPVVVGDIVGSGASQESAVVGETPNLAARLEGIAGPNRIAISAATHRLIEGRFEFESLGHPTLKGLEDPGEVFRVLRVHDGARFGIDQGERLAPMVGRTEELEFLASRWRLAAEGEGQVAVLSGEAGIGKSRLVQAFLEDAAPRPATLVDLHCSPFGLNKAFHPLAEYVSRAAALTAGGEPGAQLQQLEAWLGESGERTEFGSAMLARLLSIPTDAVLPPEMTPQVQKARTVSVVVEHFVHRAQSAPLLVLVEDAQWSDPSTWELLDALVEAGEAVAMLVAVTMRPEVEPPWRGRSNVTQLSLNHLGRRATGELVQQLTGGRPLPSELVAVVAERSDGIPLFVEELTRNLLEAGLVRETEEGYEISGSIYAMAVPSTLQDSLMARLDRLGPAKEIVQVGSVLGQEFSYELISRLSGLDGSALEDGLTRLVGAGILGRRGTTSADRYVFRQSLVREAAYSSLLLARRRALHERAVGVLEALPAGRVDDRHQLLAYHYEKAGRTSDAIRHAVQAAEEQAAEFAVQEASRIYAHALRLSEDAPGEVEPMRVTAMLHRLSELMFTQGRFAEAAEFASRMRTAAREAGDPEAEATALVAMANAHVWLEDFGRALEYASDAQALARHAGIVAPLAGGAMLGGYIHGVSGRLEESQVELDRGIALAERHGERRYLAPTLWMAGCIQNWTGRYDAAIAIADRGRETARDQRQIAQYLRCHWLRATARVGKGDYDGGYQDLREGLAMAEKMGDRAYVPRFLNTLGWLFDECHAYAEAIEHCERALEFDRGNSRATGVERTAFSQANWADALLGLSDLPAAKEVLDSVHGLAANPRTHEWMRWRYTTHVLASLGQYWIAAGDPRRAAEWVSQCLAIASEKRSWKYVSTAKRLSGVIAMHAKDWDAAKAALGEARSIAERIGHPNGVWRAHADLASLMEATGDRPAAGEHLGSARSVLADSHRRITDEHLAGVFGTAGPAHTLLMR